MGLVDTKLAQIVTPGKVSGTAITLLGSIPSGAGVLPDVNSPNKLKADSADTTPQYLDSLIDGDVFQISAGDLLQLKDGGVKTEKLENGAGSPGNLKYYGTNAAGAKGFHSLILVPSGVICMWSGTIATIPSGWYLCDGNNGTPDLRDKFIVGAKQDDGGVAKTNITGALTQVGGDISHDHTGYTDYSGQPNASNAQATPTINNHRHVIFSDQHIPPYYALAYIMKA